jgi:hypothetical protein
VSDEEHDYLAPANAADDRPPVSQPSLSPLDDDRFAAMHGRPPYRIAGIPPGIISADDFDVTEEALDALNNWPELADVQALVAAAREVANEPMRFHPIAGYQFETDVRKPLRAALARFADSPNERERRQ